jgi:hypothetical protein
MMTLLAPAILALGIGYRLSGQANVLAVLIHGKKPRCKLNKRLGGSGCTGGEMNLLPVRGIDTRALSLNNDRSQGENSKPRNFPKRTQE